MKARVLVWALLAPLSLQDTFHSSAVLPVVYRGRTLEIPEAPEKQQYRLKISYLGTDDWEMTEYGGQILISGGAPVGREHRERRDARTVYSPEGLGVVIQLDRMHGVVPRRVIDMTAAIAIVCLIGAACTPLLDKIFTGPK